MRDRPCRQFCNRSGCGPTICLGRLAYSREDPRFWLGKGVMDVPGKPFGWAHNMERRAIRDHLKARGKWRDGWSEFTVTRIQNRLARDYHRRKPRIGIVREGPAAPAPVLFTEEELARIAEHFEGANDPITRGIWEKATRFIEGERA